MNIEKMSLATQQLETSLVIHIKTKEPAKNSNTILQVK